MPPGNIPQPPESGPRPPQPGPNVQRGMNKTISQDHTQNQSHVFASKPPPLNPSSKLAGRNTHSESSLPPPHPPSPPVAKSSTSASDDEDLEPQPGHTSSLVDKLVEQLQNKLLNDSKLDLDEDQASYRVISNLISTVSKLQEENKLLKEKLEAAKSVAPADLIVTEDTKPAGDNQSSDYEQPITEHIYCVQYEDGGKWDYGYYKDPPLMFKGDRKKDQPRETISIPQASDYLENHTNIAFVTIDTYETGKSTVMDIFERAGHLGGTLNRDYLLANDPNKRMKMDILFSSPAHKALAKIIEANPKLFYGFEKVGEDALHYPPYTLFYLHNKDIKRLLPITAEVDENSKLHLEFFLHWIETRFQKDWDEADALFSQGKVNEKHMDKLYRPSELVVFHKDDKVKGDARLKAGRVEPYPHISEFNEYTSIRVTKFCGEFFESVVMRDWSLLEHRQDRIQGRSQEDEAIEITELEPYPIRFAQKGIEEELIARGNKFWRYKKRKLVCFNEIIEGNEFQTERRYMIDYDMFKRIHPINMVFHERHFHMRFPINEEKNSDNATFACMPSTIHGFDFSKKAWSELNVDRLTDVTWNKTAFQQLVVPASTKELIQAMVTEHGHQANSALDIIEGKGQGLLILLHGGPGTGKTLTAESIAELQERPLYRVTCGDIGTEPAEVEQYLGDVLEIGKTWGCVVLLDEADVFLEERSFSDQKRNAIISIFLRILEYYDGILILTTNRVGSFDEAFKSRIQLALAYPRLNEQDRYKVWQNFINMLQRSEDSVDINDLKMNLKKLARHQINGRQIRNVITMSRHLAKFRGEMLRYQHMQDAVQSVQKFNEYLSEVKGGVHDEDWARLDKLR